MMRAISLLFVWSTVCSLLYSAESLRDQGIKAFSEGRYHVALGMLQDASKDAKDTRAQIFLALTYAALGDCKTALPGLEHASDAGNAQLSKMAGLAAVNCYAAADDYAHVFPALEILQRRFPNDADVLYVTAKEHMKAFNDATFAMFQRTPSSYRVHQLSAEIFEVQNRFPEAMAEYRKALEANPIASGLHYQLGRAILLSAHDPQTLQQAREEFLRELQVSPDDAACQFQLGQVTLAQGDAAAARTYFERAVSLSPNFTEALIALGKIDSQDKQYPQAISLLEHAVKQEPSNERAHYALLTAYRNSGQLEKAKQEKIVLDGLQKPKSGEFSDFLKRLGEKQPEQ